MLSVMLEIRGIVKCMILAIFMLSYVPAFCAEELRAAGEMVVPEENQVSVFGSERIKINGIVFEGQGVYDGRSLDDLVQQAVGQELTIGELRQAIGKITNYYHEHGYFLAKAYLPEQAAADGIIKIVILEGKYGDIRIQNQSWLSQETVQAMLAGIRTGNVIHQQELERAVLLLQDIAGIKVETVLQPGKKMGTADLVILIKQDKKQTGSMNADNYGYPFTGEYQSGIGSTWNHLLAERDMLSANVLTSGKLLSSYNLMYQTALGTVGAKLNLIYSSMNYRLGEEYTVLCASGKSTGGEVAVHYPFLRSYHENLSGFLGYFHRRIDENLETVAVQSNKSVQGVQAGIYGGSKFDNGAENTYSFSVSRGQLAGAASDSACANGRYVKGNVAIAGQQYLTANTYLAFSAAGQLANKNLDSSEKMMVGGSAGVRAYPQGEASGDEGYLFSMEVHRAFATQERQSVWELIGFVDHGSALINKNGVERRNLSGAGIGVSFIHGKDWFVRADYAWKLCRAIGETDTQNGRFWIKSTRYF